MQSPLPKKLLIVFILTCACSEKKELSPPPILPVKVAPVIKQDAPIYIDTIGHVEPILTVNVVSRVKGEITGVYFDEGKDVEKGDLLFTIDPRTFQATVEKAKGTLEENRAHLAFAEDKIRRYQDLVKQEYFSEVNFDQLITDAASYSGIVKQNEASLSDAEINLSYCWIYAPITGKTGILQIDQGNVLKGDESQTLIVINQMKPIYVSFTIPEKELPKVRFARSKHPLKTIAFIEDKKEEGTLEIIDNQIDAKTGMITMRALFENTDELLWPKEFVRIRLILDVIPGALVIPYEAIQITTEGKFVYVLQEDQTVTMKKVTLGQRENGHVIVLTGLEEKDQVVTDGVQNLFEGMHVLVEGR